VAVVRRTVVGAHYGLRGWLAQRLTAAYIALYTVAFVVILTVVRPRHHVAWRGIFENQAMKLATFLFLVALLVHAWVGMRDILMDYVKADGMRLALEAVVAALLVAYAGWSLQILWSV
jgi:succinate dehydrogenase / fumarate reductase membrane anchor subunit